MHTDTLEAFRLRRHGSTDKDMVLGIFLEGALAHVERSRGADTRQALRQEVLGMAPLVGFFRYPVSSLLDIMDRFRPHTRSSHDEFVRQFGHVAVDSFLDSSIGKTLTMLAGTDVHKLLSSAPSGYHATTSFTKVRYERHGERSARIVYENDRLGPAWQQGVLERGVERVCGVKPQVVMEPLDMACSRFIAHVSW